jgi:dTDP-4-amino-4,6-dideoxygalactose transaminase
LNILHGTLPEAEKAAREIVSLPFYPEIRNNEIEFVAASIREFYQRRG